MAANSNVIVPLITGQKEKEITINTNYLALSRYLGEYATAPSTADVSIGSTFYNTTTSKLMFLNTASTWVNVA